MKKWMSLLLSALLLVAPCAVADTTVALNEIYDALDMTLSLPDGMTVTQTPLAIGTSGAVEVAGQETLKIVFALTPDDSYADMTLEQLTAEEVKTIFGLALEDLENGKYETKPNSNGVLILTMENGGKTEYIHLALNKGYFFYMEAFHEDFSPLTDAECAIADSIVDTLAVIEK